MLGRHFSIRKLYIDSICRQYTICNVMHPAIYQEALRSAYGRLSGNFAVQDPSSASTSQSGRLIHYLNATTDDNEEGNLVTQL